jgi:hypothetical protein
MLTDRELPGGLHFYKMELLACAAGSFATTRKMDGIANVIINETQLELRT